MRARRSSHSWHAECNVTRRCPYLFAIISARFHRSGYGRHGVSCPGDIQKYYVGTYGIARRDGCTTIQVGIRPVILRRRCENRSCVTTSTGSPMGSSRTTVRLSSVSSVSPACFVTPSWRGGEPRFGSRHGYMTNAKRTYCPVDRSAPTLSVARATRARQGRCTSLPGATRTTATCRGRSSSRLALPLTWWAYANSSQ